MEGKKVAKFFKALFRGQAAEVVTLIEEGFDVNTKLSFKVAHHCGCSQIFLENDESDDFLNLLSEMIERGHCPCLLSSEENDAGEVGMYPIHVITWRNHPRMIPYLVEKGCDINQPTCSIKLSVLHIACFFPNHEELVQELLKHGANPNAKDVQLKGALHFALERGNFSYFRPLVEAGFDLNTPGDVGTPLAWAVQMNNIDAVRRLIGLGADADIPYGRDSCLTLAVRQGSIVIMQLLIDAGCSVNGNREERFTPLHFAIHGGSIQVTRLLIQAGADLNLMGDLSMPPLSFAISYYQPEHAQALLDAGCDVNAIDDKHYAAIHLAAWNGQLDIVNRLLNAGVAYDKQTDDRNTPLSLACHGNHDKVIERLSELDCNFNNTDKDADTPLLYTTFHGNFNMSVHLVAKGADPSIDNDIHVTPIWNAAYSRNADLVIFLLKCNVRTDIASRGIDQLAQSDNPVYVYDFLRTPMETAILRRSLDVVQLLYISGEDLVSTMRTMSEVLQEDIPDEIMNLYKTVSQKPRSLLALCRQFIRKKVGMEIHKWVPTLEIPQVLKSYLLLGELHLKLPVPVSWLHA